MHVSCGGNRQHPQNFVTGVIAGHNDEIERSLAFRPGDVGILTLLLRKNMSEKSRLAGQGYYSHLGDCRRVDAEFSTGAADGEGRKESDCNEGGEHFGEMCGGRSKDRSYKLWFRGDTRGRGGRGKASKVVVAMKKRDRQLRSLPALCL